MLARIVCIGGTWVSARAVPATRHPANGGPDFDCPQGFNLGAQSLESYLQLPRTQAAIDDGLTTEEEVAAFFSALDRNESGDIWRATQRGVPKVRPVCTVYDYNLVDDNAA